MLSAKKVKLHGMSDPRWTCKDKTSQYKGLLNLYSRDSKLLESEFSVKKRKKIRLIKELSSDIVKSRTKLEEAIGGDKQSLRNALQEHKELQLAFQHLPPEKVAENIHQINFNQRKELDRLKYRMKSRCEKLIDRKLNHAYLEDREHYAQLYTELPSDRYAQVITGKVQDALLKQEAAIAVRYTYRRLLDLLKKDTYFYDTLLKTLVDDLSQQNNCLLRTIELGQLATENLNDRRFSLIDMESVVKFKRKMMLQSMDNIKMQVENITKNVKSLIRRDSDISIPKRISLIKTPDDVALTADVEEFEKILRNLQKVIMVPNYETIYPCLVTQRKSNENLLLFLQNLIKAHETLSNKKNHAQIKVNNLCYTMIDATLMYMDKKKELNEMIDRKHEEYIELKREIMQKGKLALNIRATLNQILFMLKPITKTTVSEKRAVSYNTIKVDNEDIDEQDILPKIKNKLRMAMKSFNLIKEPREIYINSANMFYEALLERYAYKYELPPTIKEESLIEFSLTDSTIHTRESIKAESARIVLECDIDPDLIVKPKKKKR